MKERRSAGATHSFRLTPAAAALVDQIRHPRRMGGKSRKVSDAIEWYFSPREENPSYDNLLRMIATMQQTIDERNIELLSLENRPSNRGVWSRFLRFLKRD